MIEFMAAFYNEQNQIKSLIEHVAQYVDRFVFVDDGSTDATAFLLGFYAPNNKDVRYVRMDHTGLPETVKARGLQEIGEDSWIIMLDADERFEEGALKKITEFINSPESENYTHIWFNMEEGIDGRPTRYFLKSRVFRKSAVLFDSTVHVADSFTGSGINLGLTVLHYKTSDKQIQREKEYLKTYDRLVKEGKMTTEKRRELKEMHYFVR